MARPHLSRVRPWPIDTSMSVMGTTLCSRCGEPGCDCRRNELRELLSGLYDDAAPAAVATAGDAGAEDEMWLPASAPIVSDVPPVEDDEPKRTLGEPVSLMATALAASSANSTWRPQTIVVAAPEKPFLPEPLTRKRSLRRSADGEGGGEAGGEADVEVDEYDDRAQLVG